MKGQRTKVITLFIWLSILIIGVHSIDEAVGPVTIVPNNSVKLNCTVGSPFSLQFSGRSILPGISNFRFNNVSNLPSGLSLTSSGLLSGTC